MRYKEIRAQFLMGSNVFVIGVDVGGTFTDCVVMDENGATTFGKALSTPKDFAIGALDSVKHAAEQLNLKLEQLLPEASIFSIGTTVAENAIVNRSGAKVGLLTTRGFEDTILIMRASGRVTGVSEALVSHITATTKPPPLVNRRQIKGVIERVDSQGRVIVPLQVDDAKKSLTELANDGVESLAVSLLWSFRNFSHEQALKKIINSSMSSVHITLSSELSPVMGEYERTSTTVLNAYVAPLLSKSVSSFTLRLREAGFKGHLFVMYSHGGVLPAERGMTDAVGVIEAGPAAGVLASKHLGELTARKDIIAADMGGTTFKVGVIYNDNVERAHEPSFSQYRITTPRLDVASIGAGGGSIAWIERATGLLKVGPSSAGAEPGPMCYDRGGVEPTVTDADVVLGYLNPDYFLGGRMSLNKKKAVDGIAGRISNPLGLETVEAANAIREITDAQMADLIRRVTIERGYDPREFSLFVYGGAGPVHADGLASELGVKEIVIPSSASVHCALGVVTSDVVHEYAISDPVVMPVDPSRVERNLKHLESLAQRDLATEGFGKDSVSLSYYLDFRYRRQVHEVTTPVEFKGGLTEDELRVASSHFETLYERLYGKGSGYREAGIEIVTFRLVAVGKLKKPIIAKYDLGSSDAAGALKGERTVFFGKNEMSKSGVYDFNLLKPGNTIVGPAIIETPITTVVVRKGHQATMDEYRNIRITR